MGERCSNKDTCSSGLKCKKANSQNSCYAETEKRCCKPIGAKCDDGCDCCGVDVICNGGYCQGARARELANTDGLQVWMCLGSVVSIGYS